MTDLSANITRNPNTGLMEFVTWAPDIPLNGSCSCGISLNHISVIMTFLLLY